MSASSQVISQGLAKGQEIDYFKLTLAFVIFDFVFLRFLDYRQHRRLCQTEKPKQLTWVAQPEFDKAQAYGYDKSRFNFVHEAISLIENLAILAWFAMPWLWNKCGEVIARYGYGPEYEITHSLVFMAAGTAFNLMTSLPFDLYYTFVIEEKHGFNKQTLGLFFTDMIKSLVLQAIIGGPVLAAILWVVRWGGPRFYIYVWAFVFAFQLVAMILYPTLIQPCFNKVIALQPGSLRSAIEALASKVGFPLKELYEIDGSKRSAHSNAYMYGFCNAKRIVLFDTLIKQCTESEVVAILGHELGHWKKGHTMQMLIFAQIQIFTYLFLYGQMINNVQMYRDFGFQTEPTLIGLLLFANVFGPLGHVVTFLGHLLSRKYEFEADRFAAELGYAGQLSSGLIKLQKENLGNMNPDPWYATYHYSHPPVVERLQAIEKAQAKRQ